MRKAIVECANNMQEKPEELKEEQVKVEMVRRREEDPNPRTRAWKLTVPNLWREVVVDRSDFYPRGWSHRQWFNRSNFKKKEEQARPQGAGALPKGPPLGAGGLFRWSTEALEQDRQPGLSQESGEHDRGPRGEVEETAGDM